MSGTQIRLSIFTFTLLLHACAADQHAQDLSKETLIQVIEYDDTMQKLSRTLKEDYVKRQVSLQKASSRATTGGTSAEIDRIAVDAVDKVILHGFLVSDVRRFMSDVQDARRAQEAKLQAAWTSFDAKQQAVLEKTKVSQEQLKSVKIALEHLQTSASIEEEIERLLPLFEAAYDAQKGAASPKTPNPETPK